MSKPRRWLRRHFGRWHWHETPEAPEAAPVRILGHRHLYLVPHTHARLDEEAPMATA